MRLLTTEPGDRASIAAALTGGQLVVVVLCAAWCDTCREFNDTTRRLSGTHPDVCFVWLDIEDDELLAGDIDVENFPTLAIARGDTVLHFGISLPHEGGVARLVEEMCGRTVAATAVPTALHAMFASLRAATPRSGH